MSPPGSDQEEAEEFDEADESSESESEQEAQEEVLTSTYALELLSKISW